MAKPKPDQQPDAATEPAEEATTESKAPAKAEASKPAAHAPAAKPPKKIAGPARNKKPNGAASKSGSLLPSADKLEQLKAAVTAAGNAENLLLILQHVEQAGGIPEVTESIEAYRVLKTVLEE